jgi:hypothetical protein
VSVRTSGTIDTHLGILAGPAKTRELLLVETEEELEVASNITSVENTVTRKVGRCLIFTSADGLLPV